MTDREMSTEHKSSQIQLYDPEKGLKSIAVAEAAENHYARAKDRENLLKAVREKLKAIREFVLWWDAQEKAQGAREAGTNRGATPSQNGDSVKAGRDGMPERFTIERWRKRTKEEAAFLQALEDAEHRCARICELEKAGTIRGTEGTGEFERYTPAKYIEAARMVLGTIDIDPATSELAQQTVNAEDFFIEQEDGLSKEWIGRVWLNPPYHRELAPKFIKKLVREYTAGRTTAAILLTNNCTDTEWFDVAIRAAASACFTNGRIKFTTPKGKEVLPTQGQAFLYFGDNAQRFEDVFCVIGFCVRPSRQYEKITTIEAAAQ
jgi:hypothetical protein